MWNNLSVLHRRDPFDAKTRRDPALPLYGGGRSGQTERTFQAANRE
jgi:hypothetical protein